MKYRCGNMDVTNVWEALNEFKKVVNNSTSIQNELKKWGNRIIQFIVKAGEDCCIMVREGKLAIEKGKNPNPDLTFTALDGHFLNWITGQTDYTSLDIIGDIEFKGKGPDKNKFISIIGLFVAALLGELDELEELEE